MGNGLGYSTFVQQEIDSLENIHLFSCGEKHAIFVDCKKLVIFILK